MRTAIALAAAALMVASKPCPSLAAATPYSGPTLSGLATNALVLAYAASGLDGETPAPFRLEGYVVTFHTAGDYFQITFSANARKDFQELIVDSKSESVVWTHGDPVNKVSAMPPSSEGYVLPGIIAGEILLAYRNAAKENYQPLQTGAYAIHFEPFPGGLDIGFDKTLAPDTISVIPAPTPTPGTSRCLFGCATGPGYRITVRDGRITIKRAVSL